MTKIEQLNNTESPLDKNLVQNVSQKLLFIDKISEFKNLKKLNNIELCIIKTDFDKSDLKFIQRLKSKNQEIEFWISSNETSRENILRASNLGVKNIVASPVDAKIVKDFFEQNGQSQSSDKCIIPVDCSDIAGLKVMIVDDNLMNIELLEEVLSKFGLNISSYLKPKIACEVVIKEKFDLFLLDIMMPEMSGFELAKKIKETELNQDIPIIFISALSDSQNKITSYDLGSYAYIEKPFDIGVIKSQIYNVLKNKKAKDNIASTQNDFLATIAHDLKTPIRAEINALQLLLGANFGELDESQQEIIEDILNSTKFMRDMVENILCKSKIEHGQITLSKQVYSVKELVETCIEMTKYILSDKKQRVNFRCNIENLLVPLDFLEMKRAINNLISNASQYSPAGTEIVVEISQHGDNIGISVQDFGRGIALEHQKDIFVQYMSFAKKYKTIGSGLGLYITKRIVEAHGGDILLDSKVGYGTKISLILPMYTKV